MKISNLSLILGNQLFKPSLIKHIIQYPVFMCESDDLCTHFNYHQLKILFFLTAMRNYHDELIKSDVSCFYYYLDKKKPQNFLDVLESFCHQHSVEHIHIMEIEDHFFEKEIKQFCNKLNINLKIYSTPMFLTSRDNFTDYLNSTKKPFMKTFYQNQRRRFNILMDGNQPLNGQWSYDDQNRKKTPKKILFPTLSYGSRSIHLDDVKALVNFKFGSHIGGLDHVWFATTREEVNDWVDHFIDTRLMLFGDYEDAIDQRSDFLFHSGISQYLNCGLITPEEVLSKLMPKLDSIPINSMEGFIRQLIGWREFIRGIYHSYDQKQQQTNYFNHENKLSNHWYTATTGIKPLDDAIRQTIDMGYTHHINRLMVIGNIMLMCKTHPHDVYRWFMESYIDSSDWVMGPNVFGMSQFSDGGIFATKPYFCGSNYIRKMSHYKKDDWCDVVDALYWRFIYDHQDFFSTNYRMAFMVSKIKQFPSDKIDSILKISNQFIDKVML